MSSEVQLGFGPSPRPRYVYIGDEEKSPTGWYFWDGDKADPIPETALTGYITNVELGTREYKGKENKKLLVHVSAGPRRYIIQCGFYTAFARTTLAALARLKPQHFEFPLCIETQPGEQKTVFANVYNAENGMRITCEWPKTEQDVDNLFNRVTATLEARKGLRQGGQAEAAVVNA